MSLAATIIVPMKSATVKGVAMARDATCDPLGEVKLKLGRYCANY